MGKVKTNILCLSLMLSMAIIFWRIIAQWDDTILLNIQENVSMIGDRRGLKNQEFASHGHDDMYNNWIILMTINTGFMDFFQNWFWYFQKQQLTVPLILVAEDEACYKSIKELYSSFTSVTIERSESNNPEGAVDYETKQYNKLVGERPTHILKHLRQGHNVLYCDADSVWLRNPFPHFVGEFDIWSQQDDISTYNRYCTGFLAIKSNNRTIQVIEKWRRCMVNVSSEGNQVIFNEIDKSQIRIKILDTDLFPSGQLFFHTMNNTKHENNDEYENSTKYENNDEYENNTKYDNKTKYENSTKYENVVVVHNNWIIGHGKKRERFKKFNLWYQ